MDRPQDIEAVATKPITPLRRRRRLVFAVLLGSTALAIVLGWYGWRWYTTPVPPEVVLDGADAEVVQAIEAARAEVRRTPRSAGAWGRLGLVLRAHHYNPESNSCFAQAERLDPLDPRWPYLQALELRLTDPDAALPYLQRAIDRSERRDPDNTAPRLLLAEMLLEKDRNAEAESEFRQVLSRQPDHPRAHFGLGVLANDRGDAQAALDHLTRSASSPFARQKSYAQLAAVYQRLGNEQAAAEFSRRVRQLPRDTPWTDPYVTEYLDLEVGRRSRFEEAERLEGQGQLGQGVLVLRDIANDSPDERSHTALGMTLAKMGDYDAAEPVLRTALQQAPDKMQAHYFLCVILWQQAERLRQQGSDPARAEAKYRDAAEHARAAVRLKPDHAFAHIFLGLALKRLGQREEALACLRAGVERRPELADGYLHLGEMLAENGQIVEALKALQYAVQMASRTDARPRDALTRVLLQFGARRLASAGIY